MALDTYANLKTAVADWMHRSDITGNVEDWITLAEARLNRELNPVEEEVTLTGTQGSRTIDVSSYSIVEPLRLYWQETSSGDEIKLTKKDSFPYYSTAGKPSLWMYDSDDEEINFDVPLDSAYSFRFQFRERFTLSDTATTNWLLTNYPDVYLAACCVWGNVYQQKPETAVTFEAVLRDGIPSVRNIIAQQNRAIAGVDPMLRRVGTYPYYDYENDSWI